MVVFVVLVVLVKRPVSGFLICTFAHLHIFTVFTFAF